MCVCFILTHLTVRFMFAGSTRFQAAVRPAFTAFTVPVATGHHDYKLPTIADVPAFENLLITTGVGEGPYDAKGVGELTNLTMPAAIANAVYDAVGARVTQLPITAERVYAAMREQPS